MQSICSHLVAVFAITLCLCVLVEKPLVVSSVLVRVSTPPEVHVSFNQPVKVCATLPVQFGTKELSVSWYVRNFGILFE